jgi:AcrR family transcriptional regulator
MKIAILQHCNLAIVKDAKHKRDMNGPTTITEQRRNRNFAETHRQLIERAINLIAQNGLETLSVASLARDAGMNRSTVYYHFDSRESLIAAIKGWIGGRIGDLLLGTGDIEERLEETINFALMRPEAVRLWVEDLVERGSLVMRFPKWELLVTQMGQRLQNNGLGSGLGIFSFSDDRHDAEVWSTILLAATLMAPRLYQFSLRPEEDRQRIARRYARALARFLRGFETLD